MPTKKKTTTPKTPKARKMSESERKTTALYESDYAGYGNIQALDSKNPRRGIPIDRIPADTQVESKTKKSEYAKIPGRVSAGDEIEITNIGRAARKHLHDLLTDKKKKKKP